MIAFADLRVLVVEVRLVVVEAVPEVGASYGVVRPVRLLAVDEDDPRVLVPVHGVRPDVPVGFRVFRVLTGLLEPGVLAGGVVHHEVGDDPHPALVGGLDERSELVEGAELRGDREEVRHVVAAVAKRRGVERQEPDAVDPEPLEVVELLPEPAEVAHPVVGRVEERPRVQLVEDSRPEPVRLRLEPVLRPAHVFPAKQDSAGAESCGLIPALQAGQMPERARFAVATAPAAPGSITAVPRGRGTSPARDGRSSARSRRTSRPSARRRPRTAPGARDREGSRRRRRGRRTGRG